MNKATKVLIGIGAGIAVGAAIGILYAPDEGYETRRKIVKRSKKLAGMVGESIDEGKESLEEIKDILQKQLHKVNGRIQKLYN